MLPCRWQRGSQPPAGPIERREVPPRVGLLIDEHTSAGRGEQLVASRGVIDVVGQDGRRSCQLQCPVIEALPCKGGITTKQQVLPDGVRGADGRGHQLARLGGIERGDAHCGSPSGDEIDGEIQVVPAIREKRRKPAQVWRGVGHLHRRGRAAGGGDLLSLDVRIRHKDDHVVFAPGPAPGHGCARKGPRRPARHGHRLQRAARKEAEVPAVWRPERQRRVVSAGQRARDRRGSRSAGTERASRAVGRDKRDVASVRRDLRGVTPREGRAGGRHEREHVGRRRCRRRPERARPRQRPASGTRRQTSQRGGHCGRAGGGTPRCRAVPP